MIQLVRLETFEELENHSAMNLYAESFPPTERRTASIMKKLMQNEPLFHCMILQRGSDCVGLMFYWQFESCIYLEHLAIEPRFRGQGVGTRALLLLQKISSFIILEIEPVADAVTQRRWKFYQHCGFHRLPYKHIQPLYQGEGAPLSMELLSYPTAADAELIAAFEREYDALPMRYRG